MRFALMLFASAILLTQTGCLRVQPLAGLGNLIPGQADWEYRHEVQCPDRSRSASDLAAAQTDMLNRLGRDRWELVTVQRRDETSDCWIFTFKRTRED